MNTRLIKPVLLLLFSGLYMQGMTQSYTPFYMENARWTMEAIYPVLGPGDGHAYWEIYTLHDTLIEGKSYRLLATRNLCEKWPDGKGGHNYLQSLITDEFVFGAIREEDQRVYFLRLNPMPTWKVLQSRLRNFPLGTEHLLYDFSAVEGDTVRFSDLTFWSVTNGDTTFTTRSHFSIMFGKEQPLMGHGRRKVVNNTTYAFETSSLIDGVGSSNGLFGSYYSFLTYLRCFEVDEQPLIYTGGCDPCQGMPTALDNQNKTPVRLFPNPASHFLHILAPEGAKVSQVTVNDLHGRELLRLDTPPSQLDLSMLSRGMVMVTIQLENGDTYLEKILLH